MFENFKKIQIKGGCFDVETELELFKGDTQLSVIYGRNGSGKSTIAHCIKQLSEREENFEQEENVTLNERKNFIVTCNTTIENEYKSGIFVFDENFLQNNVKIAEDGLNTIVMLGEQVELDEKIKTKRRRI